MSDQPDTLKKVMVNYAAHRGRLWGEKLYQRLAGRGDVPPWPDYFGGKVVAQARSHLYDLLELSEVGEQQVRACYDEARKAYERLRLKPSR